MPPGFTTSLVAVTQLSRRGQGWTRVLLRVTGELCGVRPCGLKLIFNYSKSPESRARKCSLIPGCITRRICELFSTGQSVKWSVIFPGQRDQPPV